MKKLKKLPVTIFVLTLCCLAACSDESPYEEGVSLFNELVRLDEKHATPSCYIVYSSFPYYNLETEMEEIKYRDQVSLYLTDGTIIRDTTGALVFSSDTRTMARILLRDLSDGEPKDQITDIEITQGDYEFNAGSTVAINGRVDVNFLQGNIGYGELNGYYLPVTNEDLTSLTVESIALDMDTNSGFLQCSYSITPGIDGSISGVFEGSVVLVR